MEVLLQSNPDRAEVAAEKIREFDQKYTALYTACREQIAMYQRTAIEQWIVGNGGQLVQNIGQKMGNVSVLKKVHVDESLIKAGESMGEYNKKALSKTLEKFEPLQDSRMGAFIKNMNTMKLLNMQPEAMLMDEENLYFLEAE